MIANLTLVKSHKYVHYVYVCIHEKQKQPSKQQHMDIMNASDYTRVYHIRIYENENEKMNKTTYRT